MASSSRLEQLRKQREQVDARIKALEARERDRERKLETRRKIITGAVVREHAAKFPDSEFAGDIAKLLDEHVTRDVDRKALGLPPLPEQADPRAPANESQAGDGDRASIPWPNRTG